MRGFPVIGVAVLLTVTLASCQPTPIAGTPVRVDRVVSGQTVEITQADGNTTSQTVRAIGIDAPDLQQQPWGMAAKKRLEELVEGRSILLEFDVESEDGFDRQLAYLWVDGVLANEQLVAEGFVLDRARSPNIKYQQRLTLARERARLARRGIWNPENPLRQTPSEFRHQNR
ncbi:MAG: thermonuclease family protein [Cyanobacteriota bacterium]|nr:thermonuclease family protein [Cyanobacteriota bacterium]